MDDELDILHFLSKDKEIILYRKELNAVTGGVMPTILLQQIIYWFVKKGNKPFYKFRMPCKHKDYKKGDSWSEELGYSRRELDGAINKLKEAGILKTEIDISRKTKWFLNVEIFNKKMRTLRNGGNVHYVKHKTAIRKCTKRTLDICNSLTETTTETTTDIKENTKRKLQIENNFEIFYKAYPKHKSKNTALKAFIRAYKELPLLEELLLILERHKKTRQWQDSQFIPYPATWINQKRWLDQITTEDTQIPKQQTKSYKKNKNLSDVLKEREFQINNTQAKGPQTFIEGELI